MDSIVERPKMNQETRLKVRRKLYVALSVLASLIVALFPCVYVVNKNISQIGIDDFFLSFGAVGFHWLVIFALNLLFLRKFGKTSLMTILAVVPISTFSLGLKVFKRVIPTFYYWHGILLFLIVYGILFVFVQSNLKQDLATKMSVILGLVFLFLILINSTSTVFQRLKTKKIQDQPLISTITPDETYRIDNDKLPNIYMFIFDEYSGTEALKRYTGYDNQKFYDDLIERGFNVSTNSYNYSIVTTAEIPNILNLSVKSLNYSETKKDELLKNPFLFYLLNEIGYDINLINDQGFISTPETYFKYKFVPQGTFQKEESLLTLLIDMSVYYPIRRESSLARIVEIHEMFDYAVKSSQFEESGLFTLGYFMFPHPPWVVDENGNEVPAGERANYRDPGIYVGQLKYANKLILAMVDKIIEKDSNSVIILLADHGYRQPHFLQKNFGEVIENYESEILYMRNILNAVYFMGDEIENEGRSGINTMRLVLDKLFELDLGLIEEAK
ncbi:MAG: hypothetical protein GX638_10385 [Crenarchaeota archaeon]|nr:hypothetical protein [Thermoproteota archaeon]